MKHLIPARTLSLLCILVISLVYARCLKAQKGKPIPKVAQAITDAALLRTTQSVRYDPAYIVLDYPGGDVPANTGVCTDVVIRTFRSLGVDLQQLVHEDMKKHFSKYPNKWGLQRPDKNIDHRRVPNLQTYFKRHGYQLQKGALFQPGDIVAWDLNGRGLTHIGIVVGEDQIVHNIGSGPEKDSGIRTWRIIGHYRFYPKLANLPDAN